jgi:hypothetical protein
MYALNTAKQVESVMPRISDNKNPKNHPTYERLEQPPSVKWMISKKKRTVSAWMLGDALLRLGLLTSCWPNLKIRRSKKSGKQDWNVPTSSGEKEDIYKIFSDGRGMKIQLNQEFVRSLGPGEVPFLEGVVRAGIEGWGSLYMQQRGLINRPNVDKIEKQKGPTKK